MNKEAAYRHGYELGVQQALVDAGVVKTAGAGEILRNIGRFGGIPAAVGGGLGTGIGALAGGLSEEGTALGGALTGGLIGAGIGGGAGLGMVGAQDLRNMLALRRLKDIIRKSGGTKETAELMAPRLTDTGGFYHPIVGSAEKEILQQFAPKVRKALEQEMLSAGGGTAPLAGIAAGGALGGLGGAVLSPNE